MTSANDIQKLEQRIMRITSKIQAYQTIRYDIQSRIKEMIISKDWETLKLKKLKEA